jgi:hypothetical protein
VLRRVRLLLKGKRRRAVTKVGKKAKPKMESGRRRPPSKRVAPAKPTGKK